LRKRYSLAVILGMTTMLLALAPQLRADRTDHFKDNGHWNAMSSAKERQYQRLRQLRRRRRQYR
jgi:hypothetical protein